MTFNKTGRCSSCNDSDPRPVIELPVLDMDDEILTSIGVCEKCLTEAMLLIRPFSVNPPPFVVR